MEKGITSGAAQRLLEFMKERAAQNYKDTEEWGSGDAVGDILSGAPGVAILRSFSAPLYSIGSEVDTIFSEAYTSIGRQFEEQFQQAIDGAIQAVSAEGFPVPDPSVLEDLKKTYVGVLEDALTTLMNRVQEDISNVSSDLAYMHANIVTKAFEEAASGSAPGGVTP